MLKLVNIKKDYKVASDTVHALKGVNLCFRENEFVAILGPSGCGKTTLLNIIGGLDQYTEGDLVIEGKSTREYDDRDWDTYRNHSIGFIFQSYHLIPHQTILQNVELALTIAGIGKEERRRRAIAALEKVGLADKMKNLPNQLSGGQAQRVAIARALINDPEIVLADEPTGALDSKTSVQIMDLLKEISKDRLVIMVTHNPELAEKYATRIVRLHDGEVTDDTNPYLPESAPAPGQKAEEPQEKTETVNKGKKKSAMNLGTGFMLSLKNLLSKRKRTAMVSVAGSIGIIGVSMVLAVSAGVQNYIASMENDMLSGYPLSITETAINFSALMGAAESAGIKVDIKKLGDRVYVDSLLDTLMNFSGAMTTNKITQEYKSYVEAMPKEYYNAIQYNYGFDMSNYIYTDFVQGDQPEDVVNVSVTGIRAKYRSILNQVEDYKQYTSIISTVNGFSEIPNNYEYILSQYDILATDYDGSRTNLTDAELKEVFESKESLILVVEDNAFSDLYFGQYGYLTEKEFLQFAYKAADNPAYNESFIEDIVNNGKAFDFFVGENAKTFKWYPNDTIFSRTTSEDSFDLRENGIGEYPTQGGPTSTVPFKYNHSSENFSEEEGLDLKVRVILQKKKGISYGCLSSGLYYTEALTDYTRETAKDSQVSQYFRLMESMGFPAYLMALPYNYDYIHYTFEDGEYIPHNETATYWILNPNIGIMGSMMGGEGVSRILDATSLACASLPIAFYVYPLDFDSKDLVTDYLDEWNAACSRIDAFLWEDSEGHEKPLEFGDSVILFYEIVNAEKNKEIKTVNVAEKTEEEFNDLFSELKAVSRDGTIYIGEFKGDKTLNAVGIFSYEDADGNLQAVNLTEAERVTYSDTVGLIIAMVNMMIRMITIALIVFTALSLVVSTVMVGIITYVSVVERVKEIGILRAVGARKKDIKRLFNAETFIIGLAAGIVGIAVTYLLSLIINLIIGTLAGIYTIAALPWWQALVMIGVSVVLTLISGLIPAAAAAKKDPVIALRTE